MAYTTQADLEKHFGQRELADLLDRDNNGTEDTGVLTHAITQADAIIDGYLAARYTTPLNPVPQIVASISANIVRFLLWDDNAPDEVRKRYDDAMRQLKDLANGLMSLPSTTTPSTTGGDGGIEYEGNERIFTMDTLRDF